MVKQADLESFLVDFELGGLPAVQATGGRKL